MWSLEIFGFDQLEGGFIIFVPFKSLKKKEIYKNNTQPLFLSFWHYHKEGKDGWLIIIWQVHRFKGENQNHKKRETYDKQAT